MRKLKVSFLLVLVFSLYAFSYWEWTPQTKRWINPKYAVKDTPKEQFEYAEKFRKSGDIEKAIREHRKLLKHYANSEYAPKSCFALGEIYYNLGKYKKAFDYYQKIVDKYPQSELIFEAIGRQAEIGQEYLYINKKREFSFLRFLKEDKGEFLKKAVDNSPYDKKAPERLLRLGMFYYDIKQYGKAEEVFRRIIESYPDNPVIEKATFFAIKAEYKSIPDVNYDIEKLEKIEDEINFFISKYPSSVYKEDLLKLKDEIENQRAKRYYEIARLYERMGKKSASLFYYKKLIEKCPETRYGKKAKSKIGFH